MAPRGLPTNVASQANRVFVMTMLTDPSVKYRPFPQIDLPDRQWPSRTITSAPRWLSTDLRDGNQSLDRSDGCGEEEPLLRPAGRKSGSRRSRSASPPPGRPSSTSSRAWCARAGSPTTSLVQVLTQSREDLIRTSFESLEGARAAIVHLYNAVSARLARDRVRHGKARRSRTSPSTGAKVLRDEAAAARTPTGISNTRPRPSRPPSSIFRSSAARR